MVRIRALVAGSSLVWWSMQQTVHSLPSSTISFEDSTAARSTQCPDDALGTALLQRTQEYGKLTPPRGMGAGTGQRATNSPSPPASPSPGPTAGRHAGDGDATEIGVDGSGGGEGSREGAAEQANGETGARSAEEENEAGRQEIQDRVEGSNEAMRDRRGDRGRIAGDGNGGRDAVNAAQNGEGEGYDGGVRWGVEELVRRNGMFCGVYLLADASTSAKREVVKFTSEALADGEEELEMKIMRVPDIKTTEGSIESTSSSSVQKTNSIIETYGTSAMQSSSVSAGLGGSTGVASFGLSFGSSDSSSDASSSDNSQTQQSVQESHTYTKSLYYFEPRSVLVADSDVLEPTEQFLNAIGRLERGDDYRVRDVFADFGTHTCTSLLLGGWWRVTANYKSTGSKSTSEMSEAASSAIQSASSSQMSASVSYGGASASVGSSSSDSRSTDSSSGSQNTNAASDSDSSIDIYQEWKGGMSGGTEQQWRRSLDATRNSNWRIIDHNVDSCRGIWRWIRNNQTLKLAVCNEWKDRFVEAMGIPPASAAAAGGCEGNANMQDFRKTIGAMRADLDQDRLDQERAECEQRQGFHFDSGACRANVCVCGTEEGLTGTDCPSHGQVACREAQKAECSTFTCPSGYFAKTPTDPSSLRCLTNTCGDGDRNTCCNDVRNTDQFLLEIRTKDCCGCGTDDDVFVQINGQGQSTGWTLLDRDSYNDFEQGDRDDYVVTSTSAFIPDQLCLKSDGFCVTSDEPGVSVWNARLEKGTRSKIGDVSNFNDLDDQREQCRSISVSQ